MSDISIPGVSSKYNTPQLIENLMKVEKRKLVSFESQKTELQETKTIWQSMNRKLGKLREISRSLFGFDNPFLNKIGTSSDEAALSVSATRQAQNGSWDLKVMQIATADRFLSLEQPLDYLVPSGNYEFTVGEKPVKFTFRGGKLGNFAEAINQRPEGLIHATVVRNKSDTHVLLIEATEVGEKNKLNFNDATTDLMKKLGILVVNDTGKKDIREAPMVLPPQTTQDIDWKTPFPLKPGMVLEATVTFKNLDAPPPPPASPSLTLPDGGQVEYQGIVLTNDPLEANLPKGEAPPPPKEITDFGIFKLMNSSAGTPLPPLINSELPQDISIPVGSLYPQATGLQISNRNTQKQVEIKNIVIRNPLESGNLKPFNPLSRAQDALVEMDGIRVQRPNNKLDDLVPGITFNLEGPSEKPVTAKVAPDLVSVKDSIINLVGTYNQFLTDLLIYTSNNPSIIEESYLSDPKLADQKKQAEKDLGKFQGDITLNQMKSAFQRILMDAYPTEDGSGINLLSQIGISTNAAGSGTSRPDSSKLRGYLEINEAKLDQALKDNFLSVKKLFGRDTTGNLVIDKGVAVSLEQYIRPFTELAGLISKKTSTIDMQISQTDKKIRDYNVYLVGYEADLKRKYGAMESSLNSMQKSFDSIDNFSKQNSGQ